MKTKVVRLTIKEQLVVNLFRESEKSLLKELKNFHSLRNDLTGSSPSTVKKLIALLDNQIFLSLELLVHHNFISKELAEQLIRAIQLNKNILIIGSIGSGKTTLLKAILDKQIELYPHQRTVIVDDYLEMERKEQEDNVRLVKSQDFGVKELDFLQNNTDQTLLCMNELTTSDQALAFSSGLMTTSKIFACLHDYDWKSKILNLNKSKAKNLFVQTLTQQSFLIVSIAYKKQQRQYSVWEDQVIANI